MGLSPRVRGNPGGPRPGAARRGSIPACAGEPPMVSSTACLLAVYPRVCGGTMASAAAEMTLPGLSPRVRGNRTHRPHQLRRGRSIPACAGEPGRGSTRCRGRGVYPRVCGGTHSPSLSVLHPAGLSPRVRGNRNREYERLAGRRSIPACAGEPASTEPRLSPPKVYPRVCGGTRLASAGRAPAGGLSPRVRGNRLSHHRFIAAVRSIPACAGEPGPEQAGPGQRGVYPRVCGGTNRPASPVWKRRGLSPRVRGNRAADCRGDGTAGSIPACAGEPGQRAGAKGR